MTMNRFTKFFTPEVVEKIKRDDGIECADCPLFGKCEKEYATFTCMESIILWGAKEADA